MRSRRTRQFRVMYAALPQAAQRQADEAYRLFKADPAHPSLRFKQVDPADPTIYSARVGRRYRAMATRPSADLVIWYWIGTHEAYNKLA